MTPRQIIHKALRNEYGKLPLVNFISVDYSYYKLTDKVACMMISEFDGFGSMYHTILAKVTDDGECNIIHEKKFRYARNESDAKQMIKYLKTYYKYGNGKEIA